MDNPGSGPVAGAISTAKHRPLVFVVIVVVAVLAVVAYEHRNPGKLAGWIRKIPFVGPAIAGKA